MSADKKLVIEPSVLPLAALMQTNERWAGKHIGMVLTGGNVDLENLPFYKLILVK